MFSSTVMIKKKINTSFNNIILFMTLLKTELSFKLFTLQNVKIKKQDINFEN